MSDYPTITLTEPVDLVRQFDRLPPHSLESEMCLLGAMMLAGDNRAILAEMRRGVYGKDFFSADHQILFDAIDGLIRRDRPVDGVTVREELINRGVLDEIGGIEYLAQILSSVPHYAHGPQYASTVRDKAVLRRLIAVANDAIRAAYGPTGEKVPAELSRRFADAAAELATTGLPDPVVTLGEAALRVLQRRDNAAVRRVATGINSLDAVIGGLARSKFTIIGAPPRIGKSQLIKQIGRNIAGRGVNFGIVSIEEDLEKIGENMLANQTGVPNHRISYGMLDRHEWEEIEGGAAQLAGLPYYIDDAQHQLDDIVGAVERLATKYKCEVVAVDHLHLISCDGQTREREVSKISKALKAVFKRCNVAGVAAAQLNRGVDGKTKPELRNLRDSGSLEADGDCIMLLYREDAVRYTEENYTPTRVLEVNVAKNKDGRVGEVPLAFDGEGQRIGEIAQEPYRDPWDN